MLQRVVFLGSLAAFISCFFSFSFTPGACACHTVRGCTGRFEAERQGGGCPRLVRLPTLAVLTLVCAWHAPRGADQPSKSRACTSIPNINESAMPAPPQRHLQVRPTRRTGTHATQRTSRYSPSPLRRISTCCATTSSATKCVSSTSSTAKCAMMLRGFGCGGGGGLPG